jgi:hypothetical protein
MRQTTVLCGIAVALTVASAAGAQSPQRILGNQISGNMKMEPDSRVVTDTATLTFAGDSGPVYTIDFITRHPAMQPVTAPGIVDIVVTQHPVEDQTPEMTMRVDGETVPLITRLRSSRSVVASIPLADLDRIANAGVVIDRTFGTELELGPGQVRMLRITVDRWTGGAR